MKGTTIKQALQAVADYPVMLDDDMLQKPVHELVCRALFEVANHPDAGQRGSFTRANKARKLIFERLAGKRRSGTHPAVKDGISIDFIDLTGGGEIEAPEKEETDEGADGEAEAPPVVLE